MRVGPLQPDRDRHFTAMALEKIAKLVGKLVGEAGKGYGDLHLARLFVGFLLEKSG